MVIKSSSILKPIIVAVPLLVVSPAANAFVEAIASAVVGVVYFVVYLLMGVVATITEVAEEKPVDIEGSEYDVVDVPIFSSENPLSEEQLLSKIIGNTLMGRNDNVGKWAEYYELSKVDESYGKIYGKTKRRYSGNWKIDGSVMCFYYRGSDSGGCWMLALDGNIVTWYKPNGEKYESEFPTILIPDNPNNL